MLKMPYSNNFRATLPGRFGPAPATPRKEKFACTLRFPRTAEFREAMSRTLGFPIIRRMRAPPAKEERSWRSILSDVSDVQSADSVDDEYLCY